jgi:hypothetical protein
MRPFRIRHSSFGPGLIVLAVLAFGACAGDDTGNATVDGVTAQTAPDSAAAVGVTDAAPTTTAAPAPTTSSPPPPGSPNLDGSAVVVEVRDAGALTVRVEAPPWEVISLSADFDSQNARLAGPETLTDFSVEVSDEGVVRLESAAERMVTNPNITIRRDEMSVIDGRDVRTVIGDFSLGTRQGRFMVDLDGVHLLTVQFELDSRSDLDIETELAAALDSLEITTT